MPMLVPWFEIGAVFGTARCRFLPLSAKCVFGHLWATCRRVLPRLPGATHAFLRTLWPPGREASPSASEKCVSLDHFRDGPSDSRRCWGGAA